MTIDTGLREKVASNVSTAAASVDSSSFALETHSATEAAANRSRALKEGALDDARNTINNPPMTTTMSSDKKGNTSETKQPNEPAVNEAKAAVARLEAEIAALEGEAETAKSDANTASKDTDTAKTELDEHAKQLEMVDETMTSLDKFTNAFSGTDGFTNKGAEDAELEKLLAYTDKVKELGDVNKDGINDGELFADAVNGFLYGEGGYLSQDRKYESDYIAAGEIPPWKQVATTTESADSSETDAVTDSSGTGVAADTNSIELQKRVFG
jgi:outer membrane murein-binding lipoprotein Lpp